MTFFGPMRSSKNPKMVVEIPAMTLAATAKMMTSPGLKPKVTAAIMPP